MQYLFFISILFQSFSFLVLPEVVIWTPMDVQPVTVMMDILDEDVIYALQVIREILWYQETLANKVNKLKLKKYYDMIYT